MPQTRKNRTSGFFREAKEVIDNAKEKIEDSKESAEKKIQDYPFASIAIAASIGAIIGVATGLLLRPKKRSWFDRVKDYY